MFKKSSVITHVAPLQQAESRDVDPTKIRVLVVDDDNASRAIMVAPLRLDGFQVTEADGIEPALACMRKAQFDVMVLDMCMPNPGADADDAGLVVLREVAKENARPNVIVFTPGISAQQARAARTLGAFIVLKKARDIRQLPIQVCAAWLRDEEALEEKNVSLPHIG
jgi:DNA-binding NtrC family response regulator